MKRSQVRIGSKPAHPPAPLPEVSLQPAGGLPSNRYVNAFANGGLLVTLARAPDGKLVRKSQHAEYSAFLRKADLTPTLQREFRNTSFVTGMRDEGSYVRLTFRDRHIRRSLVETNGWFASQGIDVFEGDIDPVRRWITDQKIEIARPRRVYFDLETDSRVSVSRAITGEARVLCWSLVDDAGNSIAAKVLESDSDQAERQLLVEFFRAIEPYDQVLAWNLDRFDKPVLEGRSYRLRLPIEFRTWLWLDHMPLFLRMNMSSSESGDEKQYAGLNAVAESLGVGQKLEGVDASKAYELWQENPKKLLEYCIQDTKLMHGIEAETGYIELLQTLCESCNVFPDSRGIRPLRQVEGFLLRLGSERDTRFATKCYDAVETTSDDDEEEEEEGQFKGAYCMAPKKGVHQKVHVADFARLYPSIILSWNMSAETWRPDVRIKESEFSRPVYLSHIPLKTFPLPPGHCIAAITDTVFANEPRGILADALEEMLRLRVHWDDVKTASVPGSHAWKEADRRSAAYKIAANSFFGVVGSPFARFFVREIAEAITQCGVFLLEETIKAAEVRGMNVVYGDTDSFFATGCTREEFQVFVKWCNTELYPRLLKEKGVTRNRIKLAYEKAFHVIVFTKKKRYIGRYWHYKNTDATDDSKPEIKGLEYKRGDTARLARQLMKEVIDLLVAYERPVAECATDPNRFVELLNAWKSRVLDSELERADFVMSKRLNRGINGYAMKVKKALKLADRASVKLIGEIVEVLRTDGKMMHGLLEHIGGTYIGLLDRKGLESKLVEQKLVDTVAGYRAQPIHVTVARMMQERGEDVGQGVRIEYVIVDGASTPQKAIPAADFGPGVAIDRFYLWEDLVFAPTCRLLQAAFPAFDWTPWAKVRPVKPKPVQGAKRAGNSSSTARRAKPTNQRSLF
jgi:DNA polymerase elongation subunit (family B)